MGVWVRGLSVRWDSRWCILTGGRGHTDTTTVRGTLWYHEGKEKCHEEVARGRKIIATLWDKIIVMKSTMGQGICYESVLWDKIAVMRGS
jgi:hypothetical protein